ncbi:UDP-N-acetylmuramoyl-tripeptide--D-alanyl-D-alanine ligase [Desulfuromonas acetoxidans]|uniref:UDP-N-acetylmuramoyl-tripeptide--D-alanyl-D-alanine ligase n=1 Tax=Desulfuromonas acetoxidans (strain DSM 684 / 11070) TaxID=281689 RepID=Q1JXB1_DESA6|nr:UDP-N-acetylmuramoyl-tripeptide--D-alanyl-D-alanine ligase [Desulfuromonas acetoxidans]EAT14881.1 UDP-N-acetylmuramoylalanyl-D-glutamyl-2,6-diaminopimelate--D-alanyl-D-alanyl ligase [Desulfuromonas acetoxidans DSM 684]MBF0646849.1 UDP-N-acetylmuramoyl-tripeptide--D-alanyl-D-alanine ligase [Desulfuromonas acetoxidans]NVD23341.1 UDP-N-acetylmuramoyl-tripeptide--D-alanyl-D-alanine ligase [Desulfuromonas acetoxidans]NVE15418.1 UDP-N-acetylmuramoyl-tripeptide--D-alanyl-D-alanine ligase [Desulfuro
MNLTSDQVATIVGGRRLAAATDPEINGLSTDSRTLQSGDLFVPLKGPNYDGHDYLRQAVEHGAAACLSEEVVGGLPVPVIQVEDTLQALGELARTIRSGFDGPVLAVTGTTGKTSTKEMLASILAQGSDGLKTEGNFNNLIGLPLTLARLSDEHRWMVLELGMSQHGEIERLTEIAQPDVALITNVGAGHLAGVGNIEGVARAKGELFSGLKAGATAVVNRDDALIAALPIPDGVRVIDFSLTYQTQVRATSIDSGQQASFTLHVGESQVRVELPLPGRHQVYNALAAAAAAHAVGCSLEQIATGLGCVKMAAGRLEVRTLPHGATVLDDSYNANPQSMQAALSVLSDWPCQGTKIAVLGDMLELGDVSQACHEELGRLAAQRAEQVLCYGDWAAAVLKGVVEQGGQGAICTSHDEILDWLERQVREDDCILVKGSRGMRMEKVVHALLAQDDLNQ